MIILTLHLTTAVPARVTVLTDARLRPITLGRLQINFRTAAPSRLYWAGPILQDPAHGAAIRADLQQGLPTLPIWMQPVVREVLDAERRTPRARHR